MLLAEELALVAMKPDSGRHALGTGEQLNACLAGLLVAELVLDGSVGAGDQEDQIVALGAAPGSPTLAAAAQVVEEKGPNIKAVLSHMSRGLQQRLGMSTWDAATAGLADAGILGPATRRFRPLVVAVPRDAVLDRLRTAAAGDGPLDPRTAVVLSMTGPARLLEVVAPTRAGRKHARQRIDHALDGTELAPIAKVVRRLIAEAAAAASGA